MKAAILQFPGKEAETAHRVDELMRAALASLEAGDRATEARHLKAVLEIDPRHPAALINLGTNMYNSGRYQEALALYRRATVADPEYALAFFDLGNVLDEVGRRPEAIAAYQSAIRLAPSYGDAHYNLALVYHHAGESRRALRHWSAYLKTDSAGPWAYHARSQVKAILKKESLQIVHRNLSISGLKTKRQTFVTVTNS